MDERQEVPEDEDPILRPKETPSSAENSSSGSRLPPRHGGLKPIGPTVKEFVSSLGIGIRVQHGMEFPPEAVRRCQGCGELMTKGDICTTPRGVYHWPTHEKTCYALDAYRKAQRFRQWSESEANNCLAKDRSGIPDPMVVWDEDGTETAITDLQDYRERWPSCLYGADPHYDAYRACTDAAAAAAEGAPPRSGFCLSGIVGSGKTTLLIAAARDVLRNYIVDGKHPRGWGHGLSSPVRWWRSQALQGRFYAGTHGREFDTEAEIEKLVSVPFLFIDNLGGEDPNPWWIDDVLFNIIDGRYLARRPIYATSKYGMGELAARWTVTKNGRASDCVCDLMDRLGERTPWIEVPVTESLRPGPG